MLSPCPAPARATAAQPLDPFTPAEQRVLQQLLCGFSNKGIAAVLVVSPRTVESHVSNLLAKTGCRNRTQLLLWALGER
ncbi:MAG: helix-turn-helix transcriptional regulator [Synechococcus sp.]